MSNDNKELDEILESIRQNKNKLNFLLDEQPFEKPEVKPVQKSFVQEPEPMMDIAPPEPVRRENPPKEEQQKEKKSKNKLNIPLVNKIKSIPISKKTKQIIAIVLGVIAVILIVAGLIHYATTAYLKPYEKEYGIKYPKGIAEEFCDAYGKNQNLSGILTLVDADTTLDISNCNTYADARFSIGSDIEKPQQFRSILLNSKDVDLEKYYNTAENYAKSKQAVTFTSIYGEKEKYQVVAVYYVTTVPSDDNGYLFPFDLYGDLTEDSFDEYEDKVTTRSLYYTGYDIAYTDSFLTLSIDSDFMPNFRFVMLCVKKSGKIVPITSTTPNDKIHYPQVWYDKNQKHNPYWMASKWQPTVYSDPKHTETYELK